MCTATRTQRYWHDLAADLGFGLSEAKRQLPSQRVVYTGMTVDSFLGTISIPPDKRTRLVALLDDFFFQREATLSELAFLSWRIQHYPAGLPYVLPFVALILSVICTDGDPVYDNPVNVPQAVCKAAVFISHVLKDYAEAGHPLWQAVPSSLYDAFVAGDAGDTTEGGSHYLGLLSSWLGHQLGRKGHRWHSP